MKNDYADFQVPYAKIDWQDGTIPDVGQNGCQVEDVLSVCLYRLQYLNSEQPCRENSIAITKIQEAILWLNERTRDREARKVEGTHEP